MSQRELHVDGDRISALESEQINAFMSVPFLHVHSWPVKYSFQNCLDIARFFIKLGNAWYTNAGDCHTQYFFKSMRLMFEEYFKYKINDLVIFIHHSLCSKLLPLIFYKYSRYLELTLVLLIMDYWL